MSIPPEIDEGVVKYQCHHQYGEIPLQGVPLDDFFQVREQLFEKNWIGETPEAIGFGNLSILLEGHQILITGTQTSQLKSIDLSHLCSVQHWSIPSNSVHSCGPCEPSSEAITHGTIYDCFEGIQAIIHIHNTEYWQHALKHYPKVVSPYGTPEIAQEIYDHRVSISQHQVFAMEGHQDGVFAFGQDLKNCWDILQEHAP